MNFNKSHRTWIRDELISNLIKTHKLIKLKNPTEFIKSKTIEIKQMSHEEAFMLTCCYKVKIILQIHNNESGPLDEHIVHLVVKMTPEVDETTYELCNFQYLFTNEIITYEHILPNLNCLPNFPRYYYSHNRASDAAIVLSDFTKDGWLMSESQYNLSIDHIIISVQELGRFHGAMYAMKHTDGKSFENIKKKLVESRYFDRGTSEEWSLRLDLGIKRATKSVRETNESNRIVSEEFLQQLETVLENVYKYQKKCVQPTEPMAVLCHGDYLRNNIAYRYDNDGKATHAMMFDFQTLRYASPMIDLCTFMALSTGRIERENNFWKIFAVYHDSMIKQFLETTKWTSSDVPAFLTYDSILREYVRFLPFGLSIAGSFLYLLFKPRSPFDEPTETIDEITRDAYEHGGKAVDIELCALVTEMFQFHEKLGVTIDEM